MDFLNGTEPQRDKKISKQDQNNLTISWKLTKLYFETLQSTQRQYRFTIANT